MSLDFNTLNSQTGKQSEGEQNLGLCRPNWRQIYTMLLLAGCIVVSLSSLTLSLFSIKNIPKPAPISIECDPHLLQKIEKQAQILEEIAKTSEVQK